MKPDNSCFNFKKTWLKYFITLCISTATLLSGSVFTLAQDLEKTSFTGSRLVRDTSATASQYLAMIDTKNLSRTTDIADILKDNPALLCSVKVASAIDAIGNGAENLGSDNGGGSMLGVRGLDNVCSAWVVKQN